MLTLDLFQQTRLKLLHAGIFDGHVSQYFKKNCSVVINQETF